MKDSEQGADVQVSSVQFMHRKGCKPSEEQFNAEWTSGGYHASTSRHLVHTKNLKLHTTVKLLSSG